MLKKASLNITKPLSQTNGISLLFGPEGDFTDQEYRPAKASGIDSVHWGQQRLRSETAAILGLGDTKLLKGF